MTKTEIVDAGLDIMLKCATLKNQDEDVIEGFFLEAPYEVQAYLIQQIYIKNLVVQKNGIFKESYFKDLKFLDGSNVSKAIIEMRNEAYNEDHISGYVGNTFIEGLLNGLKNNIELNNRVIKEFPLIDMNQCYELIKKAKEQEGFNYGVLLADLGVVKNGNTWFLKDIEKIRELKKGEMTTTEVMESVFRDVRENILREDVFKELENDVKRFETEDDMRGSLGKLIGSKIEDECKFGEWKDALVLFYKEYARRNPDKINYLNNFFMTILLSDDDLKEEIQEVFANVINEEQILNNLIKVEVKEDEHMKYVDCKISGMAYINLFELFERRMTINETPEMVEMINDLDRDFPLMGGRKTVSKSARVGQSFYARNMWKIHAERTIDMVVADMFKDDPYVISQVLNAATTFNNKESQKEHDNLKMDRMDIVVKLRVLKDGGFIDEKLLSKVLLNVLLNPRLNTASDNDRQKREILVSDYLCYKDLQVATKGNQLKEKDVVKEVIQLKARKF